MKKINFKWVFVVLVIVAGSVGTLYHAGATAKQGPLTVKKTLAKVGVERVISVTALQLESEQEAEQRSVLVKLLTTYPDCADGQSFSFKEGARDGMDIISYWAASETDQCPGTREVEIQQVMRLEVGQTHRFVFRGPQRWDQRISFRLDKERGVTALMINRAPAS